LFFPNENQYVSEGSLFPMVKFRRQWKIIAQVYSSLIIRFNGDATPISSENSFLALSYSVEQETGKDLNKESKFHCQKTRAGEEIPFCVLEKNENYY
jgi:hypothetical protein